MPLGPFCGPVLSLLVLLLFYVTISPATAANPPDATDSPLELMHRGEYDKALEQLRKSYNLFPYNENLRTNLAAAYAAVGKRQLKGKQFDEAAENFAHAHELIPDSQEYGLLHGVALYEGKHYDEAAIELEQAEQSGGENVTLLFYLGRVRYDTGDLEGAIEAWERALALDPGSKVIREQVEKARREAAVESRMEKGHSSMFEISYDEGTKSDLADAVLDALENAYNRVGSDLSYYPTARVPVILYTRKDYRSLTATPEWSGGLYDGKVRLPIGGANEITPMLRGVLSHEYTHVVVGELAKGNCPSWLNEGLAEVEERKEYDPPLHELAKAAKGGRLLPFATLEKSLLAMNTKDAVIAYQQSYSMVNFMISSYGWYKIREILVNLGNGMRIDAAIAKAFADYGLDYKGIAQEWLASLQKELGP